jgi:hypothetical protein
VDHTPGRLLLKIVHGKNSLRKDPSTASHEKGKNYAPAPGRFKEPCLMIRKAAPSLEDSLPTDPLRKVQYLLSSILESAESGGLPTRKSEAIYDAVTASLRLAGEKAVEDLWKEIAFVVPWVKK